MARFNLRFFAGVAMGTVLGYFCVGITLSLLGRHKGRWGMRARAAARPLLPQSVAAAVAAPPALPLAAAPPQAMLPPPPPPQATLPPQATPPKAAPAQVPLAQEDDIHIVFASGCNLYQQWQAELVFYSHMRVGQRGAITRIVSGCGDGDAVKASKMFRAHSGGLAEEKVPKEDLFKSSNPKARIHLAPDFEGAEAFPWLNKPLGIEHWIKHADPPVVESTIVIIDVDMVLQEKLEPGKRHIHVQDRKVYPKEGLLCSDGCRFSKWRGADVDGMTDEVREGRPVAQRFGIGGQWISKYDLKKILGPDSPALNITMSEALQYYQVGPPMMLHRRDLARLAPLWAKNMEHVMDKNHPSILDDMYAYSIAAAHLRLPHLQLDNYMSSSPTTGGGEANMLEVTWDPAFKETVQCTDPFPHDKTSHLPTFMHFCQTYTTEAWAWHKGRIPPNIFSCETPLLRTPPSDLISNQTHGSVEERSARFICVGTHQLNAAVVAYKKKYCKGEYNSAEKIRLLKDSHGCTGKDKNGVDKILGTNCWPYAELG